MATQEELVRFSKLKIGTPITGLRKCCFDNYRIIAIGYNWAVLSTTSEDNVYPYVLEPTDTYRIGVHEYNEDTGSIEFELGEFNEQ